MGLPGTAGPLGRLGGRLAGSPRSRGDRLPWSARIGPFVAAAVVLLVVFGPLVAPYGGEEIIAGEVLSAPSVSHPFGTDENGMDILSRTLIAPRYDIVIGLLGSVVAIVLGLIVGLNAGYVGGWTLGLLRVTDVFQSFPVFILAMAVIAFAGHGMANIIFVVGIINSPLYARIAYAQAVRLRELPFVDAALIGGMPRYRVLTRHILPNALAPVTAQASITVGWAILLTAGLSFVGAGLPAPTPEWGSMIAVGAENATTGQWWPALFPGLALALTIFAFASVGDLLGRRLGRTAI